MLRRYAENVLYWVLLENSRGGRSEENFSVREKIDTHVS